MTNLWICTNRWSHICCSAIPSAVCRLRRACSALSALAADPPSASLGSAITPDVRSLLAAAVADLEAAKRHAAVLVAVPPAGPAEAVAVPPTVGRAAAQPMVADAAAAVSMPDRPVKNGAAVPAARPVAEDAREPSVAVAMEVEAGAEDDERPAAAALLMIGGDAAQPQEAAEGAAVAGRS